MEEKSDDGSDAKRRKIGEGVDVKEVNNAVVDPIKEKEAVVVVEGEVKDGGEVGEAADVVDVVVEEAVVVEEVRGEDNNGGELVDVKEVNNAVVDPIKETEAVVVVEGEVKDGGELGEAADVVDVVVEEAVVVEEVGGEDNNGGELVDVVEEVNEHLAAGVLGEVRKQFDAEKMVCLTVKQATSLVEDVNRPFKALKEGSNIFYVIKLERMVRFVPRAHGEATRTIVYVVTGGEGWLDGHDIHEESIVVFKQREGNRVSFELSEN